MLNPTAAAQRQGVLQPIPTPPPPAEALKCPARKPQNVSAFALTYILLRRSCKRMGAFIIHPCLPVSQRKCKQQGPFAPRTLLRFTAVTPFAPGTSLRFSAHYEPIRHPLVFHRFPGFASYTVCCSGNFSSGREGFSSCLAHPCHRAAANTPPECLTASVSCGNPCCLRPFGAGSAPGVFGFRGHLCVHFRCSPMTRSPSQRWLCRSASFASSPPRMRS